MQVESKKYDEAQVTLKKALEIAPESFDGYSALAWLFEQKGDFKSAVDYYQKSLERRPEWAASISEKILDLS